jgi:hypothetical protein
VFWWILFKKLILPLQLLCKLDSEKKCDIYFDIALRCTVVYCAEILDFSLVWFGLQLLLKVLPDGKLLAHFQFTNTREYQNEQEDHSGLTGSLLYW